jgi:hypothetical protein
MMDPSDPDYGHATAPRGIVILSVSGMVLIALGVCLANAILFLAGLVVFCGAFAPLLAAPEPERVPVAEPGGRPTRSPASASLGLSSHH